MRNLYTKAENEEAKAYMIAERPKQSFPNHSVKSRSLLLALFLLSLGFSVYFEQELERSYPFVMYLVPYFIFLLALFHATSWGRFLSRNENKNYFLIALLIGAPFIGTGLANYLVDTPLERMQAAEYCLLGFALFWTLKDRASRHSLWFSLLYSVGISVADYALRLLLFKQELSQQHFLLVLASSAFGISYAQLLQLMEKKAAGMPRSTT